MGVRGRIAALALREVHVLLIERPGWALTRIAAEQALAARGWRVAGSAADADALLCCGDPGPGLEPLVQALFVQLPRPRARGQASDPGEVAAALDQIVATLRSGDAADSPAYAQPAPAEHTDQPDAPDADMNMDMGDGDGEMDHSDTDMDMDMDGMDGMDMSGPGGIALAGGDQDRDGLEMDVLAVRLGPVLPAWPAGLVLLVTLAGDLVSGCHADTLGLKAEDVLQLPVSRREQAALVADRIGWLLALAGARRAERRLRQVRDGLLEGVEISWCTAQLRRLADQLSRSRSLRWSLRDLGRIDQDRTDQGAPKTEGTALDWSGDVLDRLHRRLAGLSEMVAALADPAVPGDAPDRVSMTRAGLDLVCEAVRGLDLGAARLVIASVDIDLAGGIGTHQAVSSAGPVGSS